MAESVAKLSVKSQAAPAAEPARHPLLSLRREMDRLFDEFSTGWPFGAGRRLFDLAPMRAVDAEIGATVPAIDVVEKDKEFLLTAELPGMNESDIDISLSDNVLTIKGEKREEREEKKKDYAWSERRYGSFMRSFPLPSSVDAARIEASYQKGVLSVVMPKNPEAENKQRKIAIKAK